MGVTIHVNGRSNSLVHKGSGGMSKCTLPDVCKTPSPGGPIPIPYPVIISMSSDLKKGSKTVKFDGGKSAAVKGSEFSRCSGDEPGTAGGVKSSTNMKEATWILYSFDVKIEGKNACRLSDKMMMNHGNTACLSGEGKQDSIEGTKVCPPHSWIRLSDDDSTEDRIQKLESSTQSGDVYNACVARKYQALGKNVDVSARFKCDCGAFQEVDMIVDGKLCETKGGNQGAKKKQTLNYIGISDQLFGGAVVTIIMESAAKTTKETPHVEKWGAKTKHESCP